jgi:hypothetical protein
MRANISATKIYCWRWHFNKDWVLITYPFFNKEGVLRTTHTMDPLDIFAKYFGKKLSIRSFYQQDNKIIITAHDGLIWWDEVFELIS